MPKYTTCNECKVVSSDVYPKHAATCSYWKSRHKELVSGQLEMFPIEETGTRVEIKNHGTQLRPVLQEFAEAMELKLRKNDTKTGWRELPVEALRRMLMLELEEFNVALEFLSVDDARKELVDVSNFCLILRDRLSMLKGNEKVDHGRTK